MVVVEMYGASAGLVFLLALAVWLARRRGGRPAGAA